MSKLLRKCMLAFWAMLPGAITLLCLLVYLVPKHISGLSHFMPLLPMIPIFFWGVHGSRDMPLWFVFALGLVIDATTGQPPGLSSLLGIFFLALLHNRHKYILKEGFVVQWGYFAMILAATGLLHWILLGFYYAQPQGIKAPLIQWLLTVCTYPLFHQLFVALGELIARQRWRIGRAR